MMKKNTTEIVRISDSEGFAMVIGMIWIMGIGKFCEGSLLVYIEEREKGESPESFRSTSSFKYVESSRFGSKKGG